MICKTDTGRRGFTLVEVLVAVAIISVIMLAVYQTSGAALACWRTTEAELLCADDARAFLEALSGEVRSAFILPLEAEDRPFEGAADRLSFLTSAPLCDGSVTPSTAATRVTYVVREPERGESAVEGLVVERRRRFYAGGRPIGEEAGTVVLGGVDSLEFEYLAGQGRTGQPNWVPEWSAPDRLPEAVRVRLRLQAPAPGRRQGPARRWDMTVRPTARKPFRAEGGDG